jgi:hypothetical protein
MSKKYAMWIHGHAVQPQKEGYHLSKEFKSHCASFLTYGTQYFHFAVPTPVIVENTRAKLNKVIVLYSTTGSARIRYVQVREPNWQPKRIFEGSLSGDHSESLDSQNTWSVSPPHEMQFGLSVTVCV